MTAIVSIVKLFRPLNLLIIALAMYALRYCIALPLINRQSIGMQLQVGEGDFFLSCLVMLLLAAGGNALNDYFDVGVDKINKPGRVIVGRKIKRRIALIIHLAFNAIALLLSVYLAWKFRIWLALVIPGIVSLLLWLYSPVLKKKLFVGNLAVAICVAVVPVWVGVFEIHLLKREYSDLLFSDEVFGHIWNWFYAYSAFAFLLTLAREAQKDMEDLEGDTAGGYSTIPIALGIGTAKKIVITVLCVALAILLFCCWKLVNTLDHSVMKVLVAALTMIAAPIVISLLVTFRASVKKEFAFASLWSKIAMAGGVLFCLVMAWVWRN